MKKCFLKTPIFLSIGILILSTLACNALSPVPTATAVPSPVPATATSVPPLSQQLTVSSHPFEETSETPKYSLKAQTPQLTGSDDPRVIAFNQQLAKLITDEADIWRKSFQENTMPQITEMGSVWEVSYTQKAQYADIWSFKFDFYFYSDGAAHPGSYSRTVNYDLAQGRELALSDLFLPGSDYLGAISNHCIAELSKEMFFEGPFAEGAQPKPENYTRWNITPDGLLITFDAYQVAPYAAGPQQVTVPYSQLGGIIDPAGALEAFIK